MPSCKLCKRERELRESHFLPAAIYAQLRENPQPNPVLITSRISLTTSLQITGGVLCTECEDRFSRLGETWVLGNMARRDGFPVQDALLGANPVGASDEFAFYSSLSIPTINMDALVYFAMSIFWRASAHNWRNVSGYMEGIELGPFEEPFRRFLLGDRFPNDTVILVYVWPTKDVLPAAYTPRRGKGPGCHCFNFLIPGLEFKLLTGRQIPEDLRATCSYASAEKFIFSSMSVVENTLDAFRKLTSTSRMSKALKRSTERK